MEMEEEKEKERMVCKVKAGRKNWRIIDICK